MRLNVLFHIDELARDSIVASALKREGINHNINIFFTTKRLSKILRIFNPFDAIILPSLEHFKFFYPDNKRIPNNVFILPTEAVGQSTGNLRRMQAKYLGNDQEKSSPWHKAVKGFLLWGAVHKEGLVKQKENYKNKSFVVGHPRLSKFCISKKKAKKEKRKEIIGFISRFNAINTFDKRGNLQVMYGNMRIFDSPKWENSPPHLDSEDIMYQELIDFRVFLEIIRSFDKNKYEFEIRPHPRENPYEWKKFIKKNDLPIKISPWYHPFTYWISDLDYIICPPSTSIYDMLTQDCIPICIDKILKKRKNHILTESDDNNEILEYIYRPNTIEELINKISEKKPIPVNLNFEQILDGQIKPIRKYSDSIINILQIISSQKDSIKRSNKLYTKFKILLFLFLSISFSYISILKNFRKKEYGSTFNITFKRLRWIKNLSYNLNNSNFIEKP